MNLMVSAARQEHTAVLLVTHDAGIARYADRIVTVHDGQVTEPASMTRPSGLPESPSLTDAEGAR